ncbi:MAG TPA: hypothetical protein VHU82_12130, partial [Vicinamibacterales bacterium]|nr:hypothetical protein [Vicinamibacterales bacterium]
TYYVVSPHGDWRPMRTIPKWDDTRSVLEDDRLAAPPSVVRTSWSPASQEAPIKAFNNVLSARPCSTDCGGLGVRLTATKDGLNLNISAVFKLQQPRFTFHAALYKSDFRAEIMLSGGAGFEMAVEGTTDPNFTTNLNQTGAIPVDLVLPLSFGGVPLALHYHQDLSLATGFSAKTSILKSRADFSLQGNLGFIYQDGSFQPLHMYANNNSSLSGDVNGLSMGINSMVVAIAQRLLAGLGAGGFAVGPYVSLTSTLTALKQATSAASMMLTQQGVADCRQATFQMQISGGIGYAIPKPVAAVINFFLKLVHATPISENGSFASLRPADLFPGIKSSTPRFCAGT